MALQLGDGSPIGQVVVEELSRRLQGRDVVLLLPS
jgi:hypothetical protein